MKRLIGLKEADGAEFFDIIDVDGMKSIHILCYYFRREPNENDELELDEEGNLKTWARVDGTFIIVPLEEFIKRLSEEGSGYLDNELWAETKQYQYDMSEKDASKEILGEYDVLGYMEVKMSTPYGSYVALR